MSEEGVSRGDMRRRLTLMDPRDGVLDPDTAERLLDGRLPVDDVPPDARALARLIEMTGAGPTDGELSSQPEAVAVLAAAIRRSSVDALSPRRTRTSKRRLIQAAAASTVGVMTLFGGLAAANALPAAAQSVASDMLEKVGVSVPNPNTHADTHPDSRPQSRSRTSASSTTVPTAVAPTTTLAPTVAPAPATAEPTGPPTTSDQGVARSTDGCDSTSYANHGDYVSSIAKDANRQPGDVPAAAQSDCGKPLTSISGNNGGTGVETPKPEAATTGNSGESGAPDQGQGKGTGK